jgi:hypothetical protein
MKKSYYIAKSLLLLLFLQFFVNQDLYAQRDSFFNYNNNDDKCWRNVDEVQAPALPYSHGLEDNYHVAENVEELPLGNGLLA